MFLIPKIWPKPWTYCAGEWKLITASNRKNPLSPRPAARKLLLKKFKNPHHLSDGDFLLSCHANGRSIFRAWRANCDAIVGGNIYKVAGVIAGTDGRVYRNGGKIFLV